METNPASEQLKPRNAFVTIIIVVGIILALVINLYSLLNSWSMIGYADWEFQPLLSREGVPELFHSVKKCLLVKMLTALVATACIIFFLFKLLRGKRYGFWGFVITSVVATAVHIIMSNFVVKGFQKIDVEIPYDTLIQIAWTLATIAILYAVLQIKKDGVNWWRQLE